MTIKYRPEWMAPSEQVLEVARILACGILRERKSRIHEQAVQRTTREKVLDFPFDKSMNGAKPVQGGEN